MADETRRQQFTRLWTDVQPAVAAYVRTAVRDPHAAKDIVQNTAIVLLNKFDQWDSSRRFLPWALGFAKFEVLAHSRDRGRDRLVFDESLLGAMADCWPDVQETVGRERTALRACIDALTAPAREMVRLRYLEELSIKQVAKQVCSTAGATRVALMRTRRQLLDCVSRRLRQTSTSQHEE